MWFFENHWKKKRKIKHSLKWYASWSFFLFDLKYILVYPDNIERSTSKVHQKLSETIKCVVQNGGGYSRDLFGRDFEIPNYE